MHIAATEEKDKRKPELIIIRGFAIRIKMQENEAAVIIS